MRAKRILCVIGLCMLCIQGTGCGVFVDSHRAVVDQLHYNEPREELLAGARNRLLAMSVWHEYQEANPGCAFSSHHAHGFKQGFVEYLDVGSTEPPVLPPRRYWTVWYQTPQGRQDIEDWFAGYRSGAMSAEGAGIRSSFIIPTSLPTQHLARQPAGTKPVGVPVERTPKPMEVRFLPGKVEVSDHGRYLDRVPCRGQRMSSGPHSHCSTHLHSCKKPKPDPTTNQENWQAEWQRSDSIHGRMGHNHAGF